MLWRMDWASNHVYKHCNSGELQRSVYIIITLMVLVVSYREQVEKVNKLRDETVRAIIKNSNDVAVFKEEVSQHLKAIKEYADEN